MGKFVLSDLASIESRIRELDQSLKRTIIEKGKLLKYVKEKDLTHGQWLPWLESIGIQPRTAQRYIQAYEQFGNTSCASHLSSGIIFDLLSLPAEIDREEFVSTPHVIPETGDRKLVTEMTQMERRAIVSAVRNRGTVAQPKHPTRNQNEPVSVGEPLIIKNLTVVPTPFRNKHFDLTLSFAKYAATHWIMLDIVSFVERAFHRAESTGDVERFERLARLFTRDIKATAGDEGRQLCVMGHYARYLDDVGAPIKEYTSKEAAA